MCRRDELLRVCVTGPESTGKTTLARRLAERFDAPLTHEASRGYAESKGGELDASDVVPIARAQAAHEDAAARTARVNGHSLLVLDTDLVSTCVYAACYYGTVPTEVEREAAARLADLYLLCDVDVPWIPDGIRDRPIGREAMFTRFQDALRARAAPCVVVRGSWDQRWAIAVTAVEALAGPARRI